MTDSMKLSPRDAAMMCLARLGFTCETLTDRLIRFEFRLPNDLQALSIVCEFEPGQIMMIATVVINADMTDPYPIREVGEFLHRANYGFVPGNFELDYDTGQVRYRLSKCIDPEQEDRGLFLRTLSEVISPFLVFGEALSDVLLHYADASESIENSHDGFHTENIFSMLDELFQGFAEMAESNLSEADEEEAFRTLMEPYTGMEPYLMEGYLDVVRLFSSLFTDDFGSFDDPVDTQVFPFDPLDQDDEMDEEDDDSEEEDDPELPDDLVSFFA